MKIEVYDANGALKTTGSGGGTTTIDGLTDVVISSPADNEVLAYDNASGDWINQTAAEAGLAAATHNHAASDINSGTLADARVAESNVTQHEAAIDHDALTNFVANEHIDHSAVSVIAGTGLAGGGNIAADRTINLDITELTEDTSPDAANDFLATYDASATTHKKVKPANLPTNNHDANKITSGTLVHERGGLEADVSGYSGLVKISGGATSQAVANTDYAAATHASRHAAAGADPVDHDALTNFVANEHVDHSAVSINTAAGSGLSGGGTIASTRSLAVDINGLTADASPDGAADYVMTYDASATALKKVLLDNLPGGGSGGVQFATGTYVGTGSSQAITGVGFQPKFLIIFDKNLGVGHATGMINDQDSNYTSVNDYGAFGADAPFFVSGHITALGSDGFTVGAPATNRLNINLRNYSYAAWG